MDILKGLSSKQIGAIRHCRNYIPAAAGQVIFTEGDPAYGLYNILKGKVEIYRVTQKGSLPIAELGTGDVFGEMGLIIDTGVRTASAKAVEDALLLEIPGNPIDMFRQLNDWDAAFTLLQNLVCILAERMRTKNEEDSVSIKSGIRVIEGYESRPEESLAVVERSLPHGMFRKFAQTKKLKPEQFLCKEGEKAEGFYYIHSGILEVLKDLPDGGQRPLSRLVAPTITGEIGFFSGEKRTASIRALTEVEYTLFSGSDLGKLRKKNPEEALNVLFAAAQFAVHLLVDRENE